MDTQDHQKSIKRKSSSNGTSNNNLCNHEEHDEQSDYYEELDEQSDDHEEHDEQSVDAKHRHEDFSQDALVKQLPVSRNYIFFTKRILPPS